MYLEVKSYEQRSGENSLSKLLNLNVWDNLFNEQS